MSNLTWQGVVLALGCLTGFNIIVAVAINGIIRIQEEKRLFLETQDKSEVFRLRIELRKLDWEPPQK